MPAGDRERLEHLCRYVLRPPIAQEALELTSDGKVLLRLRRPWNDGTRAILFEPVEILEKLAAMIPKPRINLLVYHGIFAPNARGRSSAVRAAHEGRRRSGMAGTDDEQANAGVAKEVPAVDGGKGTATQPPGPHGVRETGAEPMATSATHNHRTGYTRPKRHSWADLLSRTFQIDVLAVRAAAVACV